MSGWRDDFVGQMGFMTLTAPGADVLPWDLDRCKVRTAHRCNGKKYGCVVQAGPAAVWHSQFGEGFSRFVEDVRRYIDPTFQYGSGREIQRREVVHAHLLTRSRVDLTLHREKLLELAIKHGFGEQFDVQRATPDRAFYVAKYASDAVDARHAVAWLDEKTGEVRRGAPRNRAWTCSRRWGVTMKQLKAMQAAYAVQLIEGGGGAAAATARQDGAGGAAGGLDKRTESSAETDSAVGL